MGVGKWLSLGLGLLLGKGLRRLGRLLKGFLNLLMEGRIPRLLLLMAKGELWRRLKS